jgi:RNA polymerase sigma factor (sigma-70 family)
MSTIATSSDRILLQIVAGTAGEEEWRSLIERHGKSMRRAAMLATGSESLMDDAVQEALLQLPRCSGRFRPRAGDVEVQVSRWLQCLTSNCALALRRAEKRRHRRESIHAEIAMSARSMPDDPRSEQLARAFEGLSERERHVLLLCHVEGLDHHGLAAALGTNATVARKRLSRAHERLRSTLVRQGCMTSMLPMVAKLDAFGHVPLPPQPTVLWVKAAATGTSPMLTTTATLVPGGAFAMSLTAIVTVPILAVSIAVGSVHHRGQATGPLPGATAGRRQSAACHRARSSPSAPARACSNTRMPRLRSNSIRATP